MGKGIKIIVLFDGGIEKEYFCAIKDKNATDEQMREGVEAFEKATQQAYSSTRNGYITVADEFDDPVVINVGKTLSIRYVLFS